MRFADGAKRLPGSTHAFVWYSIFERLTAAQRPGGVLRGGRLEIGVSGSDTDRSRIDFTVSASPESASLLPFLPTQERKAPGIYRQCASEPCMVLILQVISFPSVSSVFTATGFFEPLVFL